MSFLVATESKRNQNLLQLALASSDDQSLQLPGFHPNNTAAKDELLQLLTHSYDA
jgi:hypothetical protein